MSPISATGPSETRPRVGSAALAFVLLTLLTLVLVPVIVQQRVNTLREEIVAAEPARTLVRQLQLNFLRTMLILSERLVQGPEAFGDYAAARADESRILVEMEPLVAQLGPDVAAAFEETRRRSEAWHRRVSEDELERRGSQGIGLLMLPAERRAFEEVLAAAAALDTAILRSTERTREEIRRAEQIGLGLSFLLGLLALLAGVFVAVAWNRMRHLAAEAERQRQEAERHREEAVRQREEAEKRGKEAEEALSEVARANEARVRLLRGITHDVKNPLGAAKGYAELLEMGVRAPLLPEQVPLVKGVKRSVDSALGIIGELLDIASARTGRMTLNPVDADLGKVVAQAAEDHRAVAEAAGHTLVYEGPSEGVPARTDPARVRQVLDNLLSNAVKYTPPPGRITVSAELSVRNGAHEQRVVRMWVEDTGPGIRDELREAIFDEFSRLDTELRGHGLGLAMARRIARLLGGDLSLEEKQGPGARFLFWIPCEAPGAG